MNPLDELPAPTVGEFYVRRCRGHYHVCEFFGVEDWEGDGDTFQLFEQASEAVLQLNGMLS